MLSSAPKEGKRKKFQGWQKKKFQGWQKNGLNLK